MWTLKYSVNQNISLQIWQVKYTIKFYSFFNSDSVVAENSSEFILKKKKIKKIKKKLN